MINLQKYKTTELGENSKYLYKEVLKHKNAIFVDLGVNKGISSEIMLINSDENKNKVFGVDVDFSCLYSEINNNKNYTKILGDSSTVGKNFDQKINGLFIDTFHVKEQVLCELYYWYPHIKDGGFICFHDTNWPENKNDIYGNIIWDRPDVAVKEFFNVNSLDYENEYIKMTNYPESWGMTVVEIKKKKDFISQYKNWKYIFERRNHLISFFWNESNKGNVIIDLLLNYES